MKRYERISREVAQVLSDGIPDDFSGFGVVVYGGSLVAIPTSPLMFDSRMQSPINEDAAIAKTLVSVSRYSNSHHDGFHFIHKVNGLTDLSLFVAPPIPANYKPVDYGVGARHRTAELISLMDTVEAVVVVERKGELRAFVDGYSQVVRYEEK